MNNPLITSIAAAAVAVIAAPLAAHADVSLTRLFSDNCVLQAAAPIPVYGTADAGEKITVQFRTQTAHARANESGVWRVELKPEAASETPETLTVSGAKNSVTIRGVLVGEVWICSGQSNMEFALANALTGKADVAAANDPAIRMFTVPRGIAETPQFNLTGGSWETASPDTAGHFSAVGYYFARALRQARHVPIGMIHSSWGGTRIQAWMSRGSLSGAGGQPSDFALLDAAAGGDAAAKHAALEKRYDELLAIWKAAGSPAGHFADPGVSETAKTWASPDLDVASWHEIAAPGAWEQSGIPEMEALDGAVWYRKTLVLADADAGKSAVLTIGAADDLDTTFVNGVKAGSTGDDTPNAYSVQRRYTVPAGLLKAGANVIAVRVWDEGGFGGLTGPAEAMKLSVDNGATIPLAGQWLYRIENGRPSQPDPPALFDPNTATVLYNGMIAPLIPYRVKGFLWYQGESNASEQEATRYQQMLPAMIGSWRVDFEDPKAAFLVVQLPGWKADGPTNTSWAFLREAQSETAVSVPYTGLAVTVDVGDVENIHPTNKQPVGERLALLARRIAYNEKIVGFPMVKDWERETTSMLVTFADAGKGLAVPANAHGVLTGWEICGGDGIYHPATAVVVGKKRDQVRVQSPQVETPFHLRYAWANIPTGNLYNSEGLPASPFRTDVPLIPLDER